MSDAGLGDGNEQEPEVVISTSGMDEEDADRIE